MKKYLGIEFGSTRIKGVLINEHCEIIASGSFNWENQLVNGVWTYSLELAKKGLQSCFKELKNDFESKYHEKLKHIDVIGISGMMHGYLVFDKDGHQLAEFRTWRNTMTGEASSVLSRLFDFNIPQRWSIAHIYQAILNKEKEVNSIAFATTLAGYFHYLLTNEKVVGVGEASGIFPIDTTTMDYDNAKLNQFNELVKDTVDWKIESLLPRVLLAGEKAGRLTKEGALLLDPSGELEEGILFCPPEGDMGTGMVCTNSIEPGTGNISIGTSSNAVVVTGRNIKNYPEIDVVLTPDGVNAALVHVNNGTSEINVWEKLFKEVTSKFHKDVSDKELYELMFTSALDGKEDAKGMTFVDYFSGEPITKVNEGKIISIREPNAELSLSNFMRAHIYALLGTIRLGIDILRNNEDVQLKKIVGHGGFFTTPKVGQLALSAALNIPTVTLASADKGGPYGEAILASYVDKHQNSQSLKDYLINVFEGQKSFECMAPKQDVDGFNAFMENYKKALKVEKEAIELFKEKKSPNLQEMKELVYKANMRLVEEGLITLTWGNVSMIDKDRKFIVIKPSGVPYDSMKAEDMVVVDLNGNVIDGKYKPSSDTPTHIELYKHFPKVSSIVHTHSTFATAMAQANKSIPALGTTHADTFYGEVPCTRELSKEEIENEYEKNTGKVIVETFKNLNYEDIPGVLVGKHGPFAWGHSTKNAVDNAVILEKVAELAILTTLTDKNVNPVTKDLLKKHYERKHGKNAYYGQK